MISPELLRRYPFFAGLTESQLKLVANLAQESTYPKGATIFEECDAANRLFLLIDGSIDLYYRSQDEFHPTKVKEFFVGEINTGEAFGTSAIIDQNEYNATARTSVNSRVMEIDALALRELLAQDPHLANKFLLQVIKTLKERVMALRVQLAAPQ
jgi:CRP-like cAMP-binding protein